MMKTSLVPRGKSEYRLLADEPGLKNDKKLLLACMTHDHDARSWTLEDLRLHPWKDAPFGHLFRGDFHGLFHAKNPEDLAIAKAGLKEFIEEPAKEGGTFLKWCPYMGVVKGKTASDLGQRSTFNNQWPVLHLRESAMAQMLEIQKFWEALDLDVSSPNIREDISNVKIPNPNLQLNTSEIMCKVLIANESEDDIVDSPSTSSVPRG